FLDSTVHWVGAGQSDGQCSFARPNKLSQKSSVPGPRRHGDGRSHRQGLAPRHRLRQLVPEAKIGDGVEEVEVAEDRPEWGVRHAERRAVKVRTCAQCVLQLTQPGADLRGLGLKLRLVGSVVEARDVREQCRGELYPRAMPGTLQRIA